MLMPSDVKFDDYETIAKMSKDGWYPFDTKKELENLQDSYIITINAIAKAKEGPSEENAQ
jgi:hypothetical protein